VATWDEAADWYLAMVGDPGRGFNHLATDTALDLLGDRAGRDVLDIGCGEGSIARRLARAGARVTAAEPTTALLEAAAAIERDAPLGVRYVSDRAEDLASVSTDSIDAVMAVLVLHHIEDFAQALSEISRVLRRHGSMVAVIPHPWSDHPGATWIAGPDGVHRMIGCYNEERHWHVDGVESVRSIGWYHRTIATWFTAVADAGFVIDEVREPLGADDRRSDGGGSWTRTPRFLAWRAHRS
jgi:2-polyprenyl-3-methyl-5-hydroxy-6-metoxy-1,4-benzoquinol methylase